MQKRVALAIAFIWITGAVGEVKTHAADGRRQVVRIAKKRIIEAAHRIFKKGVDAYQAGDYESALMYFYRLIVKKDSIPPRLSDQVEYWMGKTFYRQKFYSSAFSIFKKIVVQSKKEGDQKKFLSALRWMIRVHDSSHNTEEFESFLVEFGKSYNDPYFKKSSRVMFVLALHYYDNGKLEEAVQYLRAINKRSVQYLYALYYLGVILVRQEKPSHAMRFFQEVERLLIKKGAEKYANILTLARLQIARLYYELNYFAEAIDYFKKVPRNSDYWTEAHFETAWAYFRYGNPGDALGNLWSFRSPFWQNHYDPEVQFLEAIVLFSICHFEEADQKINAFFQKYDPYLKTIKSILLRQMTPERFYHSIINFRSSEKSDSGLTQPLVESVLDEKEFLEEAVYIKLLQDEVAGVGQIEKFAHTKLARAIQDRANSKMSASIDRAAKRARAVFAQLYKKTQYFRDMIEYVKFEAVSSQKTFLESQIRAPLSEGQPKYIIIQGVELVDGSFNWWKFEDEWWRDELGYYKAKVENQCYQMQEKVN